jgi:hypothetical protein
MEFERIEAKTRDDYRGAQNPTAFTWRGNHFTVVEIVDTWYEGRPDSTRLPLRYFKVKTGEGGLFIIRYHEFFDSWSIVVPRDGLPEPSSP